jgi:thermitase
MKNKPLSFLVSIIAFVSFGSQSMAMEGAPALPEFVSGEYVVKLNPQFMVQGDKNLTAQSLKNELFAYGVESVTPFQTTDSFYLVRTKDSMALHSALWTLNKNEMIEYAEPNFIYTIQGEPVDGMPNDPDFEKLWGLLNVGQKDPAGRDGIAGADINVVPLWKEGITGSRDIVVGVIDTGIDWNHPDLKANLYVNENEIPDNGIDDDGNGFIDDVHGWNFAANTNNSNDDHNHGTHCAGTIGGVGNNEIGVVGVAWNVRLMPIKFLRANGGGTLAAAVESIKYATLMGVDMTSNSWGGGGFSQALYDSIAEARDAGILFVAAAGNSNANNDVRPAYPATYQIENIVSVAALDNRDLKASFSSFGKTTVHVAAPGVNVWSTVRNERYASYSGTSMATPHVAGVAALMMSHDSTLTFADIRKRLIATSTPIESMKDRVVSNGRVNAYNAVHGIVEEPRE